MLCLDVAIENHRKGLFWCLQRYFNEMKGIKK